MLNYIIQVILFQVLFLAAYDLFLSKETFFTKNRWYLLGTAVVSFLIPLIKIPSFQKAVPQEYTILLPEIVLSPQAVIEKTNLYQSINYGKIFFGLGCLIFAILFFIKLGKIIRLIFKHEVEEKSTYKLVWLPNQTKAFSFFKFIFLGKDIAQNQKEKIIQHELVHTKQNHSADLLFFEFLKIVMWFNPMIWMYQNRITLVHEYISDEVVTKETTKENYINNILSDLFQVENISFINQFYKHSLIKKRIIMMTKEKSKKIKQLRYLLLVPVLASMLFYTACTDETKATQELVAKKGKSTMYYQSKEGLKSSQNGKESYFDFLLGFEFPDWEEINYDDLTAYEKEEYDNYISKTKQIESKFSNIISYKIYKNENGRKTIAAITDFSKMKQITETEIVKGDDVPFAIIETPPTFPGCSDGDRDCFNKKMIEFVQQNFDVNLANDLGLSSGKKKIYVQFKIDKDGSVSDIKARAPHPELKNQAIKMMDELPKLKPGLQRGKAVRVGYTLPISFVVK